MNDLPPKDDAPTPMPPVPSEPATPAAVQSLPPPATLRPKRRFQLIWLIPLVAVLIAGYLGIQALQSAGPTITLSFRSADGLKAGQTKVRHKAVDLGTVQSIRLSDDLTHVIVKVEMQREATAQLTSKARFWVVRPRLTAGNVSGLDTVLTGPYVELDPGGANPGEEAKPMRDFVGLEEPPAVRSDEPGQSYNLHAGSIGGVTSGSPVMYRNIVVGEVLRWDLSPDGQGFEISIFVRKPFDRFVHDGTHFWNSSGIGIELGASGVELRLESLQALISGAIAFDTPPDARDTPVSKTGTDFRFYRDEATASTAGYKKRLPFLTRFQGSVRGLAVGAPVDVYGIQVGNVTGIKLHFAPSGSESYVDVKFEIQPERILSDEEIDSQAPIKTAETMVNRGMRMQLTTANYLTGQMVLSMNFVQGAAPAEAKMMDDGTILLPGVDGGLANLTTNLSDISRKLAGIPFDQIGRDLESTLHGVNSIANGPELKDSLKALQGTLTATQELVRNFDTGMAPMLKRLPEIAQALQNTLDRAGKLVTSADQAYGGNSEVKRDAERLLAQLSDTARSVRLLADYLNQHPEALIQGRTGRSSER